ncbi:hypothetical protein HPB50_010387 [Hyalomma asiaticum]|uniref:Uncharacterized protein n=1 Tax=Hyalomma asiaticum TaxID=266040 RepID=A0ACB7TEC7_HYAAI|nr:hypothetical protein HPB50_010387 [Hyalomma asiaticum]
MASRKKVLGKLPVVASFPESQEAITFDAPRQIGRYSVGGANREYIDDACNKMYLRSDIEWKGSRWEGPKWNLYDGFEKAVRRDWSEEDPLQNLLKWLVRHGDEVIQLGSANETPSSPRQQFVRPDFICSREALKAFMCTPFSPSDEWMVQARLHDGVIYLRNVPTPAEKERLKKEFHQRPISWKGRFYRNMVTRLRGAPPEENEDVDETQTYHAVLRGKLGLYDIVFEAEMMAIDTSQDSETDCEEPYLEFRARPGVHQLKKYREHFSKYVLLKWWSQARLAGVPSVLCASYNKDNIIEYVEKFQVSDIPEIGREHDWSEQKCLQFLHEVLDFIKAIVTDNQPSNFDAVNLQFRHKTTESMTRPAFSQTEVASPPVEEVVGSKCIVESKVQSLKGRKHQGALETGRRLQLRPTREAAQPLPLATVAPRTPPTPPVSQPPQQLA